MRNNKRNKKRHYFGRSAHLISTVAGKEALTSWRYKLRSFVKIALHVYPFFWNCSLVRGSPLSSIKAAKWAWKFSICHENDITISSFSFTASLSVSCIKVFCRCCGLMFSSVILLLLLLVFLINANTTPYLCFYNCQQSLSFAML